MNKIVIIPTYNEIENIEKIIRTVFLLQKNYHVLIIDDGSPDGTADVVKHLQNEFSNQLFIIERKGKQGLGTAYIAGFKWSIEKKYDYIFEMDADFSHNPNDLERLYLACENNECDMSIGSRYVKSGKVENWPLNRILISYGASLYVRFITFMPIKDCTAGFVCYKREVLENINLNKIHFIGYAFQIEMKYRAYKKGFKIVEVPIIFTNRELGESKMNGGIIHEAVFGVLNLKWKSIIGKL